MKFVEIFRAPKLQFEFCSFATFQQIILERIKSESALETTDTPLDVSVIFRALVH